MPGLVDLGVLGPFRSTPGQVVMSIPAKSLWSWPDGRVRFAGGSCCGERLRRLGDEICRFGGFSWIGRPRALHWFESP